MGEGIQSRKGCIGLSNTHGSNAQKIKILLDGAVLDSQSGKRNFSIRHLGRRGTSTESKWVPIETLSGTYTSKPVPRCDYHSRMARTLINKLGATCKIL